MAIITERIDQLEKLFAEWSPYTGLLSLAAYEIQTKISEGEDASLAVKREDMHSFYRTREQLRECLSGLGHEIETNMLAINRDQHDIIYLNKIVATHNQITGYLGNYYQRYLARFDNIKFDIEPPERPTLYKGQDMPRGEHISFEKPVDPYWNEYMMEECLIIENANPLPILIRLLKTIAEGFEVGANILHQAVTQSLVYKNHPDLILLTPNDKPQPSNEPQPTEPGNGVKLQWEGGLTDLAELVCVLVKSKTITNKTTGKRITNEDLGIIFQDLFGIEKLDVDGLVSKRILNTYKPSDGKTFIDTLQRLMQERVAESEKKKKIHSR